MNNKGQTLVLFVILLPLILILCAYAFDNTYIVIENNKLKNIADDSINYLASNESIEKVTKVIKSNDKNINIVFIDENNVHLKKEIEPIFGKIIGFDKYKLEVNRKGKISNGELVIEEKGN